MPTSNEGVDDGPAYGTAEHAYAITEGRFPGVRDALQWLTYAHLPEALRDFSRPFYRLAVTLIDRIRTDSPELTTSLNAIIAAKDSAMRAGIRHDTGRAGAVPRPQEVVAPPTLTGPRDASLPLAACNCEAPEGHPHASRCPARGSGTGFVQGNLA